MLRDQYSTARGKYRRVLELYCRKCNKLVAVYQKDGPGDLLRMYIDRISTSHATNGLIESKSYKNLIECKKCTEPIGYAYIYPPEKRKAIRLFQNSVVKKIVKSSKYA